MGFRIGKTVHLGYRVESDDGEVFFFVKLKHAMKYIEQELER
jgi:hypothetical protein